MCPLSKTIKKLKKQQNTQMPELTNNFIILKGVVIDLLKGNFFKIKLDNGYLVRAKTDNQLRNKIGGRQKIFERDKVKVKIPLGDLPNLPTNSANGIIVELL